MTTTLLATSTHKIVAIGMPPGLLRNLQLQLCNNICKATPIPVPIEGLSRVDFEYTGQAAPATPGPVRRLRG
jgi:hypothetical protein